MNRTRRLLLELALLAIAYLAGAASFAWAEPTPPPVPAASTDRLADAVERLADCCEARP